MKLLDIFSDANYLGTADSIRSFSKRIDGGSATTITDMTASIATPLTNRYVSDASLIRLSLGVTLGIHTLRISNINGHHFSTFGIELIAQDTTSTATRSKIQIPAQTVVSYGKKFSLSATAPHYNPFDGLSGAKTLSELGTYIDTATSLGMENWKGGTANYHRPFNGGRIVRWVDSSGAIKTSVTMMPPNAQNITATASNAVSDAHIIAGTDDDTINFDTTTIANATPLSEVAKTFHWREFGNGSANGGTGAAFADWSMVSTAGPGSNGDEVTYVMDEGLTQMNTDHAYQEAGGTSEEDTVGLRVAVHTGVQNTFCIFIGTGFSAELKKWSSVTFDAVGNQTLIQNLPYGTHIIKLKRDNTGTDQVTLSVDGVDVQVEATHVDDNALETLRNLSFHQPKMPPIPENAVVIADYMLMADFVPVPSASGIGSIHAKGNVSKGVRYNHASRDTFFATNETVGWTGGMTHTFPGSMYYNSAANFEVKHVGFGHAFGEIYFQDTNRPGDCMVKLDGSNYTETGSNEYQSGDEWGSHSDGAITKDTSDGNHAGMNMFGIKNQTLGVHTFGDAKQGGSGSEYQNVAGWETAIPIHTSSHYQTFETPFLHELVGGDRNMEQTNLVVTADGKTWDEVTRDTSYIAKRLKVVAQEDADTAIDGDTVFTAWRGKYAQLNRQNKDFAIAYDRIICLKAGQYRVEWMVSANTDANVTTYLQVNQSHFVAQSGDASGCRTFLNATGTVTLQRGEFITCQFHGTVEGSSVYYNNLTITEVG